MNILQIRERVNYSKFGLELAKMNLDQRAQVAKMPGVGDMCNVKLHPNARSSAYGQMWEHAILAGYVEDANIKALVIFTERESVDADLDFALVDLAQVKEFKPERVREFSLTPKHRH